MKIGQDECLLMGQLAFQRSRDLRRDHQLVDCLAKLQTIRVNAFVSLTYICCSSNLVSIYILDASQDTHFDCAIIALAGPGEISLMCVLGN